MALAGGIVKGGGLMEAGAPFQFWENTAMRRVAVYRDGNQMAAQIGPDWVQGIAGFGDTVADALRDLAQSFAKHRYELRGNSVGIEVAGRFIEVHAHPGQSPSDLLIRLAAMMEEGGYRESDFPEPNWEWLANEERVFLPGVQRN
jgi:hypothetical protein